MISPSVKRYKDPGRSTLPYSLYRLCHFLMARRTDGSRIGLKLANRRPAGGERTGEDCWNLIGGCELDKFVGNHFQRNKNGSRFTGLSGCAHPGAEHSAMGGSLVMSMVPGMLDRLGLSQSADGQNTEHQEDRDEFEDSVIHGHSTERNSGEC